MELLVEVTKISNDQPQPLAVVKADGSLYWWVWGAPLIIILVLLFLLVCLCFFMNRTSSTKKENRANLEEARELQQRRARLLIAEIEKKKRGENTQGNYGGPQQPYYGPPPRPFWAFEPENGDPISRCGHGYLDNPNAIRQTNSSHFGGDIAVNLCPTCFPESVAQSHWNLQMSHQQPPGQGMQLRRSSSFSGRVPPPPPGGSPRKRMRAPRNASEYPSDPQPIPPPGYRVVPLVVEQV